MLHFENLAEGLKITVMGLLIVFLVLIIIWIVLEIMKKIFDKTKVMPSVQEVKTATVELKQATQDDTELIAVLTAAVAMCLNTSTYNLKIKSYKRVENASPNWNTTGRKEILSSRL